MTRHKWSIYHGLIAVHLFLSNILSKSAHDELLKFFFFDSALQVALHSNLTDSVRTELNVDRLTLPNTVQDVYLFYGQISFRWTQKVPFEFVRPSVI